MTFRHVWLLPVAAVCSALTAMFSGYIIGASLGHFPPFLPFISDGGAFPPEASVFGFFLNIAGCLYAVTIYVRHRQIVEYCKKFLKLSRRKWWYASVGLMFIGLASSLGILMVANFRYVEHFAAHMVGALLTFFAMLVYAWGQVVFSYVFVRGMTSPATNHIRLLLIIVATSFLVLHELAAFTRVFIPRDAGEFPGWNDPSWRKKDSPFYTAYMVATSCEWGMTLVTQLFILTFALELRSTYACAPRVVFKRGSDETAALNGRSDV